jgi:hypothetical protein
MAMNKDEIRQALARGYCTKRNENKVLDLNLIEDMAVELEKSGELVDRVSVEEIEKIIRKSVLWTLNICNADTLDELAQALYNLGVGK